MWRVAMIVGFQILLSATAHGQPTQKESRAIVLVIDKSGSMRDQNRMTYAKGLAKSIARQLIDADYFGVIAFDLNPTVVLDLEEVNLLRQKGLIDQQIDSLKPAGQTHFLPALLEARRQLERNTNSDSRNSDRQLVLHQNHQVGLLSLPIPVLGTISPRAECH